MTQGKEGNKSNETKCIHEGGSTVLSPGWVRIESQKVESRYPQVHKEIGTRGNHFCWNKAKVPGWWEWGCVFTSNCSSCAVSSGQFGLWLSDHSTLTVMWGMWTDSTQWIGNSNLLNSVSGCWGVKGRTKRHLWVAHWSLYLHSHNAWLIHVFVCITIPKLHIFHNVFARWNSNRNHWK